MKRCSPPHEIHQEEVAKEIAFSHNLSDHKAQAFSRLFQSSTVQTRYSVLSENERARLLSAKISTGERMTFYEKYAPELALKACEKAIKSAGLEADEITDLVIVTCTGFVAPGIDTYVIQKLALNTTVNRYQLAFHGCSGSFNALRLSHTISLANPKAITLLVSVELCSIHFHDELDPQSIVANSLFGDGSAACICSKRIPGISHHKSHSYVLKQSEDLMSWKIGDFGFQMELSSRLPNLIEASLKEKVIEFLNGSDYSYGEIKNFIIHPGGPRILSSGETALGLPKNALIHSRNVLKRVGNLSSATIFFVLSEAFQSNPTGPFLLLGFSPGITVDMALLCK